MAPMLEVPEIANRIIRWSVEEYEHLAEQGAIPPQAELVRGLVIQKMPKSPLHRALSKRLYDLIHKALPAGFVVSQEAPLRLADSEPEPDIAVVHGEEIDFLDRHPTTAALVVEVAVSSAALDRLNATLYAEAGVEEYWIVLGRERQVEVYRAPTSDGFAERQVTSGDEFLQTQGSFNLRLSLTDLFGSSSG